jgi:hypothetical protein
MRRITTYERLHRHVAAWADRDIERLLIVGPAGVGKSSAYRLGMGNRRFHLFGGRLTPLQLYLQLCDHPHRPIVLDDISALLRNRDFRDMLKSLCETGERVVRWNTTTSKLDVAAILDRFDAISFEPLKAEVIARMIELFPEDRDIIDMLIELPALPTLRTLVKARCWRDSQHLHLVEELLDECGVPEPVATLAEIMLEVPESEWFQRYAQATRLTDRTYRRHKHLARQLVACRKS